MSLRRRWATGLLAGLWLLPLAMSARTVSAADAPDSTAAKSTAADSTAANSTATQPPTDVLRSTLANGLRVIIVRNTLAPVVSTSVNYLVGSDEAPAGFPGMAHAQEHMMFRGSAGLTADQLADIGAVMGGDFNADTRESLTQYLFTVPSDDLDVALHIESLRMRGVLDSTQGWDQERGAIEQEVAQDRSNPDYVLYTKLRALAFANTPYAHDALGTRPSFDHTTAQMLQQFHAQWYGPNNAILVIVGNLQLHPTLAAVRQLFGGIPRTQLPARPAIQLQPMHAASFTVDTDRPNGALMLAVRVPGMHSPDFPALEVLSDVLSSRRFDLYGLVAQGKAIDTGFSLDPLPQAGLAYATAEFTAGKNPKVLEQQVRAILARVASQGVPGDLVQAAKLQEQREAGFEKNSIEGLASIWSDAVALYGLRSPDEDLQRIERVTVADVDRVAHQYLKLDQAVSATMLPRGSGRPVVASGGFGGQENISLGQAQPTALPAWARQAVNRLVVPPATTHPVVTQLPNGLTLIVQPETVSDTVSVIGHIRNRSDTETPPGQEGVSELLDALLPFGTEHLGRVAYQRALDSIGAQEQAGTDFEVDALSQNFDRAVQLLADNELHPALPQAAMSFLQPQLAQEVAANDNSPGFLAQHSLVKALYPPHDPSVREATEQSVDSLTLQNVWDYYRKVYRPDLATIVVIGKVTPQQAQATIAKYFGAWAATGPKPDTDLPVAPPNPRSVVAVPDASRVQDQVTLAETLSLTRSDPDYYALQLGNAVLGGGFYSTRLSIQMRKNTGLVYTVGSQLQAGRTRAVYIIEYACDPQNVSKAAAIATEEVSAMQKAPPGADELARVKSLLLRQIPLSEASMDQIAEGFIQRRELNVPLDEPTRAAKRYIQLSGQDVQAAFRKWMRPDALVRVVEGPPPG
ncbi:MAG: M16 family metallopeptidase [Steroidobacteraceae bacterium]